MGTLKERFDAKVDRTGECHLWTGAKTAAGNGQMRVDGKLHTAAQISWQLEHGDLSPGMRVVSCRHNRLCVRIEHLRVEETQHAPQSTQRKRAERGTGSMRQVAEGKWKLTVDAGRDDRGHRRRVSRTIRGTKRDATRALAVLTSEVHSGETRPAASGAAFTVDDLIDWYIGFARDVRGLERTTVFGYDEVYRTWLKDRIGHIKADRLTPAEIDRSFGNMRKAGLSHSRMNNARAALSGAYKWGRRHDKVGTNPMRGFELPKSSHVTKKTIAPEIDELLQLLEAARQHDDILAPVLTLAATTGMRRGELAGLRRDRLDLENGRLTVDRSVSEIGGEIEEKPTKTHDTRSVHLDDATVEFLRNHIADMDARAQEHGVTAASDGFIFTLDPSCNQPMRPELMTRRMRQLRKRLGATAADFDATILAMRKFTTTELMDAGFNPAAISGRQGHTVQVMLNNYSSRRSSADQAAADHLGSVVHKK